MAYFGIITHGPSLVIREITRANQFKLYDKDGNEGGLTATYTNENSGDRVIRKRAL